MMTRKEGWKLFGYILVSSGISVLVINNVGYWIAEFLKVGG